MFVILTKERSFVGIIIYVVVQTDTFPIPPQSFLPQG